MARSTGLRVIAGSGRGRRLKMVPGAATRPIGGRVKEALFNIIGRDIEGARFLDLFGGTGGVGIEALSRGAARAVFLDTNRRAIKTIQENLATTGLSDRAEVYQIDALRYLGRTPQVGFDYVYVAPPQYHGLWMRALQLLDAEPRWLRADGWVIVQIDPKEYVAPELWHLRSFDQRRYGSTALHFYERIED